MSLADVSRENKLVLDCKSKKCRNEEIGAIHILRNRLFFIANFPKDP